LASAAQRAGWEVERLPDWRAPERLRGQDVAVNGEWLFCEVIAQELELLLLEPPLSWLIELPEQYRRRSVSFSTLGEARRRIDPAFVKPAKAPVSDYEMAQPADDRSASAENARAPKRWKLW
jgi:hypothetical protein